MKEHYTFDLGGGSDDGFRRDECAAQQRFRSWSELLLYANAAEVQRQMEQQKEQISSDMDKLHNSVTPLELGKTLHQAQNDIAERMKLIEGAMSLKIDRSEMANLQTLATSLKKPRPLSHRD